MKRLVTYAFLTILTCASSLEASRGCCTCESEMFDVYIGAGYRRDQLHQGDSESVIFISDTFRREFNDVEMVPVFIKAQYLHPCKFYANLYVSYAKVYDGSFTRTGILDIADEFTVHDIVEGIVNKQEAFDASGALGWQFQFLCDFISVTPMLGYANYQQNFWADRLDLIFGDFDFVPCEAYENYKGYWRGPWLGFSSTSGPYWCNWFLNFGYDYTYVFYTDRTRQVIDIGDDDLDEVDTALTINSRAHGYGNHAWLGVEYRCDPKWSLGIYSDWRWFHANSGPSRFKFTTNLEPFEICGSGRFDGADWNSWNIFIMLGYHWF